MAQVQGVELFAEHQAGVFSRPQAMSVGVSDRVLQRRVEVGKWQRVHPGVYAAFTGPLPPTSRHWAAVLACGHPRHVVGLSHLTAAALHGLRVPADGAIHVTVRERRRLTAPPGIVVHRTRHLTVVRPLPRTGVEDTVVDLLGAARTLDEVVSLLAQACQTGLTTATRLRTTLNRRDRTGGRRLALLVLGDVAAGAHSALERRYLSGVERAHGLPRGHRQVRDGVVRRDVVYGDYATVAELDGRLDHAFSRFRDQRRDNAAATHGLLTLRYGWSDVVGNPVVCLRRCTRCSAHAATRRPCESAEFRAPPVVHRTPQTDGEEARGSVPAVPRLVLASASPARLATLRAAGLDPEVIVSGVDESDVVGSAAQVAGELATRKARAVAARPEAAGAYVVGCDSVLEFGGEVLGKPRDADDARARWLAMRGASGVLHTGHCLVTPDGTLDTRIAATTVFFAAVTDAEVDAYVATGEPLAVAGAFTLDGLGAAFVERIDGDPHNVVGISVALLRLMTDDAGVHWPDLWQRR